jgi:NTP pyrophosphatase (non-canonical NTP hydrolase)
MREYSIQPRLVTFPSSRNSTARRTTNPTAHHRRIQPCTVPANPMQLDEYQQLAARTLGRDRTHEQQLANAALGLTGEAGETAEIIKKHLFHATPLDQDALIKELGDCLWYIGAFATVLGVSLDDVAQRNIDKLRKRYPEGFDPERSRNRTE